MKIRRYHEGVLKTKWGELTETIEKNRGDKISEHVLAENIQIKNMNLSIWKHNASQTNKNKCLPSLVGLHWKPLTSKPRARQRWPLSQLVFNQVPELQNSARKRKKKKKRKQKDGEGVNIDNWINYIQIQKCYKQITNNNMRVAEYTDIRWLQNSIFNMSVCWKGFKTIKKYITLIILQ